jgi:hypothetical protein
MKEDNLKDRAMREFSQLNKEIEVFEMPLIEVFLDDGGEACQ